MTCIAGIAQDGVVVIGGDSAGSIGSHLCLRADEKVFRNGDYLFGCSGSFRMAQLIRYAFAPPAYPEGRDPYHFMVTAFIDSLRACLKKGGLAIREKEVETTGNILLVGFRGSLYDIQTDYQVGSHLDGYYAVGSGRDAALGALFSTEGAPPNVRVRMALLASEHHNTDVRGPFVIETLDVHS